MADKHPDSLHPLASNSVEAKIIDVEQTKSTALVLTNLELTSLLPTIWKFVNLTTLDLSKNRLAFLPAEIGRLVNLTSLNLSNNKFESLPIEIGKLINLTSLDISNNRLKSLPTGIQNLKKLKTLILDENSLPIPPEILKKTSEPQVILDYYFSSLKKPLNECKVLVVGQGSVGKTSLIRRLLENIYNPKENKTEGIDIRHFNFRAKENTYNINVWDFGGQEIMHATHQFFLTKRSLYLLVLDSRLTQEENRIEYWLKMIQSFGGDSPVLMVGNKTDQHPLDIDRSGLQKKYPNIVGIFVTSAATGRGMEELRSAIAEQIHSLPHVRDLLPESWFMVKKQLEELGRDKNFINHDEFLSLCSRNEVGEESSQRTLIGFMHDLGVVLRFQDDPRLEALGILNPQWVTNGVYKILNAHTLFQSKGKLTIPMLNTILDLPEYPRDKRLFIVDMMKKFELCYDIEPDKIFLIPDLLPKDEPFTGEWENALAFQYHYTVLPSSVITRFIVRTNELIHKTVWRSGVILKSGENTALVKADTEDKKVYIWVNGAETTRRDFLSSIRGQFELIHKTITKLEVREKVPVPGQVDVVVDFQHLLTLEQMGMNEYLPEGMTELVSVKQLLNGVSKQEERQRGNVTINIHGNVQRSNIVAGDKNQAGVKK
jgi:internalin A